jgi:hypothetical protein
MLWLPRTPARLLFREKRLDAGFRFVLTHQAGFIGCCDSSVPVNQERVRQALNSITFSCRIIVRQHSIRHVSLGQQTLQYSQTAFVHRHANNGEALGAVCLLESGEPGNFLFATVTLRCPEIQQKNFAVVIVERCAVPEETSVWQPFCKSSQIQLQFSHLE